MINWSPPGFRYSFDTWTQMKNLVVNISSRHTFSAASNLFAITPLPSASFCRIAAQIY